MDPGSDGVGVLASPAAMAAGSVITHHRLSKLVSWGRFKYRPPVLTKECEGIVTRGGVFRAPWGEPSNGKLRFLITLALLDYHHDLNGAK